MIDDNNLASILQRTAVQMIYDVMRCGVPLVSVIQGTGRPTTVWYGEAEWPSKSYWVVPGTMYNN